MAFVTLFNVYIKTLNKQTKDIIYVGQYTNAMLYIVIHEINNIFNRVIKIYII